MADEEYNKKLQSLQQYIPFLDNMITQLKDPSKRNREQQLNKMQSLHSMITDKRKKLKLETLIKCEDVISKLYEKVHNKPICLKKVHSGPEASTPASPSPPREILAPRPLTIPTERVDETRIPKVDIYSSAGESLNRSRVPQYHFQLPTRVPDMSRPPISFEDLKTLEDDVQEKINEKSLKKASLQELNSLREKLTEEIYKEEVLSRSPQKKKDELESINTTVRNNLNLTKKLIQPPDKSKSKDNSKPGSSKAVDATGITSPKKDQKVSLSSTSSVLGKSPKILKEPDSIFGSVLSHIDDQIVKKKKEVRRSSLTGKDEKKSSDKDVKKKDKKHSTSKDESSEEKRDSKDAKKKEKSSSVEDKNKTKDDTSKAIKGIDFKTKHHNLQQSKLETDSKDKEKHSSTTSKSNTFSLSGKKAFEAEEEKLKKNLGVVTKTIQTKVNSVIEMNEGAAKKDVTLPKDTVAQNKEIVEPSCKPSIVKKIADDSAKRDLEKSLKTTETKPNAIIEIADEAPKEPLMISAVSAQNKKETNKSSTSFKRLADKYNPKPRKPAVEQDMDKELSDIIEEKMKSSPPKLPVINQMPVPVPPPLSLLQCAQMEPATSEPASKLPSVLQTILTPSTTQLINSVVKELRQKNSEMEINKIPLLPTPVVDYAEDNFVSEYVKEDFSRDDFSPSMQNGLDFNNFSNQRQDRLKFEPPNQMHNNHFSQQQMNNQAQRFIPPLMSETFIPQRPFKPVPQGFQKPFSNYQPNQNTPKDLQPLDYYPPNAPTPVNQYNCGPPLLSPEAPHFHNETKPNFGMMPSHDSYGHNDDTRWRQEEHYHHWDRDKDMRYQRDPRTYKEYREMRDTIESRPPNRDIRSIRDPRVNRELRENSRDPRDRDPRLNRDVDRDRQRDIRTQSRDSRPSRFDRLYSRHNRPRSRSRSRSYSKETFASPLDSLYTGKDDHKTGKGYGVQNFRIPKFKKEEDKDQSEKVSSTIEDVESGNEDISSSNEVTENVVEADEEKPVDNVSEVAKEEEKVIEQSVEEPPKLDVEVKEAKTEAAKPSASVEPEQAKPADQTILAQFFANLLGSQNKKDKKTALYSLINTFADSFSEKELSKIKKIIKTDEDDDNSEEEGVKKTEQKVGVEENAASSVAQTTEDKVIEETDKKIVEEEEAKEDAPIEEKTTVQPKSTKRVRRISSTSSKDEKTKEEETVNTPEPPEMSKPEDDSVVVTVGERIKSRKRAVVGQKTKKKCKTELDLLHEDIQDMFIRDGVLTATGKRMCRLLKDDPNALTTPQAEATPTVSTEHQKIRKKPGPKPKPKPNPSDTQTMKNIRVVIQKMPDNSIEQNEDSFRRSLRNSITKLSYAESDTEDTTSTIDDSLVEENSAREDTDDDSIDLDRDKTTQIADSKSKTSKRKRGKGWACGNIPSNKKRKKKLSGSEPSDANDVKDSLETKTDEEKTFVEPNKEYYLDFTMKRSYRCKLCDYQGRFITNHYRIQHPDSEVLTARLSPAVAKEAIEDSEKNLAWYESLLRMHSSEKFHFVCRICSLDTTLIPTMFYDHLSTHTGEYRHICPICNFCASNGKALKAHMHNIHGNGKQRVVRKTYAQSIFFAYLCEECNYVQMDRKNVEDHINIFHLQKPKIYKINMSTYVDPKIIKSAENSVRKDIEIAEDEVEDKSVDMSENKLEIIDKTMPPPSASKRRDKPGPKCMKEKWKAARRDMSDTEDNVSDTSSIADGETTNTTTDTTKDTTPLKSPVTPKRKFSREVSLSSEEDYFITGRTRRAAKDKATEKLKTLMEQSESGAKRKSLQSSPDESKNKKDSVKKKNDNTLEDIEAGAKENEIIDKVELPKPEKMSTASKEVDLNVFTCQTDIQEENKKIAEERLQLMDELNKSVGSRTSLNFVDKLCDRLSNNDVLVKQEPKEEKEDSNVPGVDKALGELTMPILENNSTSDYDETTKQKSCVSLNKKPVLDAGDMKVSNAIFDVVQKNDKVITEMIQKLKGKLSNILKVPEEPSTSESMDYDNEGPPPLTHVNELTNVKPTEASTKTLLIGGTVKVIKYPNNVLFSCLVPPCVFSTENEELFRKHCSESHKQQNNSTLCDICGVQIYSSTGSTLLENVFKHTLVDHADFMKIEEKQDIKHSATAVLRIRKLSGDSLSSIKTECQDNDTEDNGEESSTTTAPSVDQIARMDETTEAAGAMVELTLSEDNPFPFKISGVMSLAEPVPSLAPISKSPTQLPIATPHLVVKEAKLSPAELSLPRKTPKAMAKFIASVSDLYKCPHYYCLFSTNFRDFLERHLKWHKVDQKVMIPCVYCDMKTPWEHVPMHIDIRHAHCRYACSYCLYRAVVKQYVFLHQDQVHPDSDYSVIALPQSKNSKKFALADVKLDAKNLCEPYVCTPSCGVKFLYENEFKKHLQTFHKSNFVPCGYKNCKHRVQALKMPNHWHLNHGVSIYQCGCCKFNDNDVNKLYTHFAMFHPSQQPNIFIRILPTLLESGYLEYTSAAFAHLRRILSIPSSCPNENKLGPVSSEKVPTTSPSTLPILTSLPQTATSQNVTVSSSPTILNHTLSIVPSQYSPSGSIIVNKISTQSSDALVTSVAKVGDQASNNPTPSEDTVSFLQCAEIYKEVDPIAPLEHITLGEDNVQNPENSETCEADPLSLEAEAAVNESSKSAADSSGDESDGNRSKRGSKSGLQNYQLYKCAFCSISFSNLVDFKRHTLSSLLCRSETQAAKPFACAHCSKIFKSAHILMEHIQCHGELRFTCSLCEDKFPSAAQTRSHMKNRHNVNHTSITPLNPNKHNIDVDEYVVKPKLLFSGGVVKETNPGEVSASEAQESNVYTPETIDKLPMRHILSCTVKCGLCSYSTKVRTNMVRHLQFHSEEKAVPDTAPVNPVPCLEKNEKMFDKMINLASSSHASGRMGGKQSDSKENDVYPEFVPSHCRYVCCAHDCSYICPEEGNLRHHLIALHSGDTSFTCVHCKSDLTPTDADSLIKHFKLHGLQLYKCPYCAFIHNLRHKVEKHVADNHLDLPVKVVTMRFMESEPKDGNKEASTSGASVSTPPTTTKQPKPWRCCMCKHKSVTLENIQQHALEKHEIDSQFKCALCAYKTNDKETFSDHFKTTHANQSVDIIYAYRKIEEEKEADSFDTTPLWQRDRPRVRHIRGILFDETTPAPAKNPKRTKSANNSTRPATPTSTAPSTGVDTPVSGIATPVSRVSTPVSDVIEINTPSSGSVISVPTTPVAAKNNLDISIESVVNGTADVLKTEPSVSDDLFKKVNSLMRESREEVDKMKEKVVIVIEDEDDAKEVVLAKDKDNKNAPMAKNRGVKRRGIEVPGISKIPKVTEEVIDLDSVSVSSTDSDNDEFSEKNLKLKFGMFGMSTWKQFKCPVCNVFKSRKIMDFVFHLFKEMKVHRFKCDVCMDESITYRYMYKHVRDNHAEKNPADRVVRLPPNKQLLVWLQMVIQAQSQMISKHPLKMYQGPFATSSNATTFECEFCGQSFQTEQDVQEHFNTHWNRKPYGCSGCTYDSFLEGDVTKHISLVHDETTAALVVPRAPTVEGMLNATDEQHAKETETKPVGSSPAEAVVNETTPLSDPLDVTKPESPVRSKDDDPLSDSDLIIVTKTERNVPQVEGDVYCCEYCAFMCDSEAQVFNHAGVAHEFLPVSFKRLNRKTCEARKEHVGCVMCPMVGSEVAVRQHHLEKHPRQPFNIYRVQCALCPGPKRFLKMSGLKVHFHKIHSGREMTYTSLYDEGASRGATIYKCTVCPYQSRDATNAVHNLRQHLKVHFRVYRCGICQVVGYKTRADAMAHCNKEHPDDQPLVMQDAETKRKYDETLAEILNVSNVTGKVARSVARKSTSASARVLAPSSPGADEQPYTFYGTRAAKTDLNCIMTSVDINGVQLNMSAKNLGKIFDLDVVVALEDCNSSGGSPAALDS